MTASQYPKVSAPGRASDDRRDAMLTAVDVGIWYCDLPFDELTWDRKVKEHFWLPPDARVTIGTFYERLHADDRERTRQAIEESIAQQTPYVGIYTSLWPSRKPDSAIPIAESVQRSHT